MVYEEGPYEIFMELTHEELDKYLEEVEESNNNNRRFSGVYIFYLLLGKGRTYT